MIVTSSTLLGLTSMNGSYEIHLAMLVILFVNVEVMILPSIPSEAPEAEMEPGSLRRLCIYTHSYLMIVCFMTVSPRFSNSALLQIANFFGLGLYIFTISKVSIEIYDSKPLVWMRTPQTTVGSIWL